MEQTLNPNFSGVTQNGSYATASPTFTNPPPVPVTTSISATDIGSTQPVNLPTYQPPQTPDISSIDTQAQNFANSQMPSQPTAAEAENASLKSKFLTAYEKITGKPAAQLAEEQKAGLPQFQQQLNDINGQIKQFQVQQLKNQEQALNSGTTLSQAAGEAQRIARSDAIHAMSLAAISQTLQGNIALAQQTADKAVEAQFGPVQDQLDYLGKAIDMNYQDLSREDKKKADQQKLALDERQRLLDEQKANKTSVQNIAMEAANNYADASTINNILKTTDVNSAIIAAGKFLVDPAKTLAEQKTRMEIEKLKQDIANGEPITGEFAPVINGAANLVGADKAKTTKTAIAAAIANKDYSTAYAQVANNVEDSLTGTNKTKFADARTDIGVMSGMRTAIQNYVNAGGDLGFLKGTADTIAKKFGQLAEDPRFAALGVQLQREFQSYRNNMTGAAFTPEESKEYASVNPRTNASLDLNLATIDGAIAQLTNRVTSTVNARVPGAQKIYDLANTSSATTGNTGQTTNAGEIDPTTQPVGSVFTYKGKQVKKTGQDQYEIVPETPVTTSTQNKDVNMFGIPNADIAKYQNYGSFKGFNLFKK